MDDFPDAPAGRAFEDRLVRLLDQTLGMVLAVLVFAMMVLTFLDVLGRQALNSPVPAAFEITEVMMGFTVYLGLPVISARREHLTIGLLDYLFTGAVRRIQGVVLNLLIRRTVPGLGARGLDSGRRAGEAERAHDVPADSDSPLRLRDVACSRLSPR